MAIVSEIPFHLQLIKHYPTYSFTEAEYFYDNEKEAFTSDLVTISAEENEDIFMKFDSDDSEAKLYLEALDIMPIDDVNIKFDVNGNIYRCPFEREFTLYEGNGTYDQLRVDYYRIAVICHKKWYYGIFQIRPKPMSFPEWTMMKDDLENEIKGLAQDIIRRNIGLGDILPERIQSKLLYDFFIIKKYSQNVLAAMIDIAENPRSEIITQYDIVRRDFGKKYTFDAETMKRYTARAGADPTFKVPVKVINYDIQENRWIKKIVSEYEKKLMEFIRQLSTIDYYSKQEYGDNSVQYINEWRNSISSFKSTAEKLKKMASVLSSKDWIKEISELTVPRVPHTLIMDSRYNVLYQMYMDLKKESAQIELDSEFSYSWKRSSKLYEMWCFLKVYRILTEEYNVIISDWDYVFTDTFFFPFLREGTKLRLVNERIRIELIYDSPLPRNREDTERDKPLYIARGHGKNHNRPDIVINIFDMTKNCYIGSLIIECKYRKLRSFWSGNSERSSLGQFEAYYNNARSIYIYGDIGTEYRFPPVQKVIVLTPDLEGEGYELSDFEVYVKSLKPIQETNLLESLKEYLVNEINKMIEKSERFLK